MNRTTRALLATCAAPLSRRHLVAGRAGALVFAGLGTCQLFQ